MSRMLAVARESWPIRGVFRISRGARTEAEVVLVTITDGETVGRGECVPYTRYGESIDSVIGQIQSVAEAIAGGMDRSALLDALPAGAARNAVDCALWDLEAKSRGLPAWKLAGLAGAPQPVTTVYTLSVDSPDAMGAAARENAHRPRLKLKMTGDGEDLARVTKIRENAPGVDLVVDANEAWRIDSYLEIAPKLAELGVSMIEQPLPAGDDAALVGAPRATVVCADESCHDTATLDGLEGKYDMVNIKLDKTGGLTEALRLKAEAEKRGFRVMVGCMIGTSLAMAPGMIVSQGAEIVDLDAPLLLAKDRDPCMTYNGSTVMPPEPALWG
ncbi:N-acetyl-D-Glu racemase DgcA [Thalassobaculum salexigens]|uniref:N-acetyl-D-Glu racemase DgcA n=1 Tax=Thalassobaculum salexigens TaxID=455360 RepID=UPI00248E6185|nr:N-acetyl-D-Glu racemase DgcA [Thalassobaculum salexigens]